MTIDISFGQHLQTLTMLPIQQGKIDVSQPNARVWFNRQSANTSILLNGTPYLDDTIFDVEVMTPDIDLTQSVANTIKTALNGYRGMMIFDKVCGVFVSDHEDGYTPRNLGADEGYSTATFQVRILS